MLIIFQPLLDNVEEQIDDPGDILLRQAEPLVYLFNNLRLRQNILLSTPRNGWCISLVFHNFTGNTDVLLGDNYA
jgi:hypothetical protein